MKYTKSNNLQEGNKYFNGRVVDETTNYLQQFTKRIIFFKWWKFTTKATFNLSRLSDQSRRKNRDTNVSCRCHMYNILQYISISSCDVTLSLPPRNNYSMSTFRILKQFDKFTFCVCSELFKWWQTAGLKSATGHRVQSIGLDGSYRVGDAECAALRRIDQYLNVQSADWLDHGFQDTVQTVRIQKISTKTSSKNCAI